MAFFGKTKKVEIEVKVAVTNVKVPTKYEQINIVIKRGKKEKKISNVKVTNGYTSVLTDATYA